MPVAKECIDELKLVLDSQGFHVATTLNNEKPAGIVIVAVAVEFSNVPVRGVD